MLGAYQDRTLQELVGISAPPDEKAAGALSATLRALDGYCRSMQGAGSQQAKKVRITNLDAGAPLPYTVRLRSQAELDRLLSGGGVLLQGADEQSAVINFDELEDGGNFGLQHPLFSTNKRIDSLERSTYRDNMAHGARENEFGQALLAEYSAQRRAELAPYMRALKGVKDDKQVLAEVDVVLRLRADDPAHDEYVIGSAKSSITGTSDIDTLLGVAGAFAQSEDFQGHKIHLAFYARYVPDSVHASLVARCEWRGVHLYQRSGSNISRVA